MKGFKVVAEDRTHLGFVYQEGLNIDTKPFSAEGSCVEGGLYFFEKITDVIQWLSYGVYLYTVEVPEDHQYVIDPSGDKYRASGLILSNPLDLRERSTWEYLAEQGVDIHSNNNAALRYAAEYGYLDVVKYLVENGADIRAFDDIALCIAATRRHLEVVEYLVSKGADIHARNDFVLRWSVKYCRNHVFEYLKTVGAKYEGI